MKLTALMLGISRLITEFPLKSAWQLREFPKPGPHQIIKGANLKIQPIGFLILLIRPMQLIEIVLQSSSLK